MTKLLLATTAVASMIAAGMALNSEGVKHRDDSAKFTFEQTTVSVRMRMSGQFNPELRGRYLTDVHYVLRNEMDRAYWLVNVNCSLLSDGKLVGTTVAVAFDVHPLSKVIGAAEGFSEVKPDAAECSYQAHER